MSINMFDKSQSAYVKNRDSFEGLYWPFLAVINYMDNTIEDLIDIYRSRINDYQSRGMKVFASSSFQSHSIPMLKILSEIDRKIPVYFLNTGFHFAESIEYKKQITDWLGLNVIDLGSPITKVQQITSSGELMFTSDPDNCCYMNKTLPMEPVLAGHDVWITGVRKDQNANRQNLGYEAKGKYGITRFHPMLEWSNEMISEYMEREQIPPHPLEAKGYYSIGCEPCTQKPVGMMAGQRGGRWEGMKKTECGLHTELIEQ